MQRIDYTTHEQWLELRKGDITSTDCAALFNLSPYQTYFELWHTKAGKLATDFNDNDRMMAGRHIESAIAAIVAEKQGWVTQPLKCYMRIPEFQIGSSFDYRILHENPAILECKNVDGRIYRDRWTDDECPDHIELQLQHQLLVSGYERGVIAALVGGNEVKLYEREADIKVHAAIKAKALRFWYTIGKGESPNPMLPDDADAMIALAQYAEEGETMDARGQAELDAELAHYDRIGREIADLEEIRKASKAGLLDMFGKASKVFTDRYTVSAGMVKDTPPTIITPEMVGQTYGGRAGYRMLRVTERKEKEA